MAASDDGRWRPPPEMIGEVRDLSLRIVQIVRPAARALGYAIAVHGSLERDLDLVAIPWTDEAEDPLDLVKAVQAEITAQIGECYRSCDVDHKPHGRLAWWLHFQNAVSTCNGAYPFVDLSVMPRRRAD